MCTRICTHTNTHTGIRTCIYTQMYVDQNVQMHTPKDTQYHQCDQLYAYTMYPLIRKGIFEFNKTLPYM